MEETRIETPEEVRLPFIVDDYGLVLVHDITGEKRNWLHEIGVKDNTVAEAYAVDAGYKRKSGWKKGLLQMWLYTKEYPLYVGEW